MENLQQYIEQQLREGQSPDAIMRRFVEQCAEAQCKLEEEAEARKKAEEAKRAEEEKAKAKEARRLELGAILLNAMADYFQLVDPDLAKEFIDENTPLEEQLNAIDSAIKSSAATMRMLKQLHNQKTTLSMNRSELDGLIDKIAQIFG